MNKPRRHLQHEHHHQHARCKVSLLSVSQPFRRLFPLQPVPSIPPEALDTASGCYPFRFHFLLGFHEGVGRAAAQFHFGRRHVELYVNFTNRLLCSLQVLVSSVHPSNATGNKYSGLVESAVPQQGKACDRTHGVHILVVGMRLVPKKDFFRNE